MVCRLCTAPGIAVQLMDGPDGQGRKGLQRAGEQPVPCLSEQESVSGSVSP